MKALRRSGVCTTQSRRRVVPLCADSASPGATANTSITIEICSLGGDLVLRQQFTEKDSIKSVKHQIQATRGTPIFQQQLVWQGGILLNNQFLGELGLPLQGVAMQLAVQIVPDDAEIGRARQLLKEIQLVVDQLDENAIQEISMDRSPPLVVEVLCMSVLYLVAGVSPKIATKANGLPKDVSWNACQSMLNDSNFPDHLRQVPEYISDGRLSKRSFTASGQRFSSLQPFMDAQMAYDFRCEDRAAKALFNWLTIINTFHKVSTSITERLEGTLGRISLFDVINHAPLQPESN